MDSEDLSELLAALRRIGGEPTSIEVKSGAGGFPTSIRETLVAFANTDGGTIVIGVDETAGFALVDLPDAATYRDRLVSLSRDAVTPPLQISADVAEVDGARILVAQVPVTAADQRPVYVKSKGVSTGAYLRTGDGDRRMSEAEIALVYASRTQPLYDREPVETATYGDLDRPALMRTLERVRVGSAALRGADDIVALHRLGVLTEPSTDASATLAGLLTFGDYPQQHFPQLMVSVVVHPVDTDDDTRFLDNVTVRGSIPEMVSETLSVLRRNLAARAVVVDEGRADHLDYPLEAIREAVVNALLHRDYSPTTRGTQVQVELFGDRLVIRSPGGLYGAVTEEDLGEIGVSSSRNAVLASLLSDTYLPRSEQLVAENRASGIPTMIAKAKVNGLPRPLFDSSVTTFTVTMGRSELLGPQVRKWLAQLDVPLPTAVHEGRDGDVARRVRHQRSPARVGSRPNERRASPSRTGREWCCDQARRQEVCPLCPRPLDPQDRHTQGANLAGDESANGRGRDESPRSRHGRTAPRANRAQSRIGPGQAQGAHREW